MSQYITNTQNKREQLRARLDRFATFSWDGKDAWDFGAFIINENREGLKFYNGPSFSNEYTSPQFGHNKQLMGVNFEQQKINFKIGVYWISEEDYRKFVYWLNPLVIGNLRFDFEPNWFYLVKLAGVQDSKRVVVGYENNSPRYYTEMELSFEIQGEPCAYAWEKFTWTEGPSNTYKLSSNDRSDLPVDVDLQISFTTTEKSEGSIIASMFYTNGNTTTSKVLFDVSLKNLTYDSQQEYDYNLTYSSKDGLLYISFAGEKYQLLNLLTTTTSGQEFVDSMQVNKLQLPGQFNHSSVDYGKISLEITFSGLTKKSINISSRARTNLI